MTMADFVLNLFMVVKTQSRARRIVSMSAACVFIVDMNVEKDLSISFRMNRSMSSFVMKTKINKKEDIEY